MNKKFLCKLYNEKHSNNKVRESYFGRFFDENFNLHFGVPQSNFCCTREELKGKLKSPHLNEAARRATSAELVVHKRKASQFYSRMTNEVESKDEPHVLAICFDFMQNVQLPRIPVQETFYLRQLTTRFFVCTCSFIYIMKTEEEEAKTGPNEVCSLV